MNLLTDIFSGQCLYTITVMNMKPKRLDKQKLCASYFKQNSIKTFNYTFVPVFKNI